MKCLNGASLPVLADLVGFGAQGEGIALQADHLCGRVKCRMSRNSYELP